MRIFTLENIAKKLAYYFWQINMQGYLTKQKLDRNYKMNKKRSDFMLNEKYGLQDWVKFSSVNEDEEYEILPYFEIVAPSCDLERIQRVYNEIMKSED